MLKENEMDEIICVLDKSGSMGLCQDDALHGFNRFIDDQLAINDARLTVIFFDDTFEVSYEGKLSGYKKLDRWPVRGMTALFDAIGKSIAHVAERFSKEKPKKVILGVLTDGHENASKEYSSKQIADMVKAHTEKYGWKVLFLAADQSAWDTAQGLNIPQSNTFDYKSSDTRKGFDTYSSAIASHRS